MQRSQIPDSFKSILARLKKPSAFRSLFAYFKTIGAIILAIALGNHVTHPSAIGLIMLFIAGRQHSLYILNHDASHSSLFQSQKFNKLIATLFSILPMFHHPEAWSFVDWKRVHLKHHRYLFTDQDPNYVGRMQKGDTNAAPTARKLIISCLLAIPETIIGFFQKSHLRALLLPFHNDAEMEMERLGKLSFFILSFMSLLYFHLSSLFLLYWILPMILIYPMILKYHDLTEHHWEQRSDDVFVNTRSVNRSFLFKCLFSFLPRGLHREHHLFPRVSVVNLPKLKKLLQLRHT